MLSKYCRHFPYRCVIGETIINNVPNPPINYHKSHNRINCKIRSPLLYTHTRGRAVRANNCYVRSPTFVRAINLSHASLPRVSSPATTTKKNDYCERSVFVINPSLEPSHERLGSIAEAVYFPWYAQRPVPYIPLCIDTIRIGVIRISEYLYIAT